MFPPWILKLLPGAVAVLILVGAGLFIGARVKQVEVDKLEAQLNDYRNLGERVKDLKAQVDVAIKVQNKALVETYERDMDQMRADFNSARTGLAKAADELKRRGRETDASLESLARSLAKEPSGSPEWVAQATRALAVLTDTNRRQELCAATPVAEVEVAAIKSAMQIGKP